MEKFGKMPEWASVCVKLLQGPIYRENATDKTWNLLITNLSLITEYFGVIGVSVLVDQSDGFAFLTQINSENSEEETDKNLPKLIRERSLSVEISMLCVILREALDQFDTSQDSSTICVLRESEIKDRLLTFLPEKSDQTKIYRKMDEYLNKLEELTFIKEINKEEANSDFKKDREFEIRRIIRAKVTAEFLEEFKRKLVEINESK